MGCNKFKSRSGLYNIKDSKRGTFLCDKPFKKAFCLPIFAIASKKQSIFLQGGGNRNFIPAVFEDMSLWD